MQRKLFSPGGPAPALPPRSARFAGLLVPALLASAAWAQFETVQVGSSRHDLQQTPSYGKLIAVSSDGVAHGAYMGGANVGTGRRVLAWCVTDLVQPGPATPVTELRSGFACSATTGPNPPNGLAPNAGVVAFHTASGGNGSWFGVDFAGCSLAFNLVANTESIDILWPHVAVDYRDKIHVACLDAGTGTPDFCYYNSSADGVSWEGLFQTNPIPANGMGGIVTAAKLAPGAALLFGAPASCATGMSDWFCYETRDELNDLAGRIAAGPPDNLTRSNCADSPLPFRFGNLAYADVDAIYDSREEPHLLVAWSVPLIAQDSMLYEMEGEVAVPFVLHRPWQSAIWFHDVTAGISSRIAGWLSADDENGVPGEELQIGQFHCATDRVQLAHDQATGFLYALWNQYSPDDLAEPVEDGRRFANGELFMACSADGGLSWGPRVNVSGTPCPDCAAPNCQSETYASLAERVEGGFLHLSYLLDGYPGSSLNGEGPETENPVRYQRIPVGAVPPHGGEAWDAAGHLGLGSYRRTWCFATGHPEMARVIDRVELFNEGWQERQVEALILYHDSQDLFGGPTPEFSVGWDVMQGDPVEPGPWIHNPAGAGDWDGRLPAQRRVLLHLSVAHEQLPLREQAFRFVFDDGTERVYRYVYEGPNGEGSRVELMDLENLAAYQADTLYQQETSSRPGAVPARFALLSAAPNPFNPGTELHFTLERAGVARLRVFNLQGEEVAVLADGPLAAGSHHARFAGETLAGGLYLAMLESGGKRLTIKLMLLK